MHLIWFTVILVPIHNQKWKDAIRASIMLCVEHVEYVTVGAWELHSNCELVASKRACNSLIANALNTKPENKISFFLLANNMMHNAHTTIDLEWNLKSIWIWVINDKCDEMHSMVHVCQFQSMSSNFTDERNFYYQSMTFLFCVL